MNKLILLALLLCPVLVYAADTTATFGDANSSGEYRMKADVDGVITYASNTGIVYPYERYTTPNTNNTLTAAESGKVIVDTGGSTGLNMSAGSGCSKHILPRAAPGLQFTFVTGAKCRMTIDTVDTSDLIEYSISGTNLDAGDSILSTGQAGEAVTLFSTVANKWSIKNNGSVAFTDNGTN